MHSVANFARLVLLPVRAARTVSDLLLLLIIVVVIYIWQQQEKHQYCQPPANSVLMYTAIARYL